MLNPPYNGTYLNRRLAVQDARSKVVAALSQLFKADGLLLACDLSEMCIVHHLATYLQDQFPDLHVDVEYNGVRDTHPKTIYTLENCNIKQVWPDIIIHWRMSETNVFIIEVKCSTNRVAADRANDDFKLMSFTSPQLPEGSVYAYHVGLFLDIVTGPDINRIGDSFSAFGTWYVDGNRLDRETLLIVPLQ